MKKQQVKKLVLAKETVRALVDMASVRGGYPQSDGAICGGETATSCRPYYCPREDTD